MCFGVSVFILLISPRYKSLLLLLLLLLFLHLIIINLNVINVIINVIPYIYSLKYF